MTAAEGSELYRILDAEPDVDLRSNFLRVSGGQPVSKPRRLAVRREVTTILRAYELDDFHDRVEAEGLEPPAAQAGPRQKRMLLKVLASRRTVLRRPSP